MRRREDATFARAMTMEIAPERFDHAVAQGG
jgi:hypothetical protein